MGSACYRVRGSVSDTFENVSLFFSYLFVSFFCIPPPLLCLPCVLFAHIFYSSLPSFLFFPLPAPSIFLVSSLLNILLSSSPFPIFLPALSSFSLPIHPFVLPPAENKPSKTRHCLLRFADKEGERMKQCEASLAQFLHDQGS